jgi:5-(carboxyamino)imidazole ribonucleotide mutase
MAISKRSPRKEAPTVAILMGSSNDWDVMQHGARQLKDFGVSYEARALSAHRTPELLADYVKQCVAGGTRCFIAGAGGAAHLAGVVAALTTLPVLAVPLPSPVATFAIGDAGSANAGLFAVAMLAMSDEKLGRKLQAFRAGQADAVKAVKLPELS